MERTNLIFDLTKLETKVRDKHPYLVDISDKLGQEVKQLKLPGYLNLLGYNRIPGQDLDDLITQSTIWVKEVINKVVELNPKQDFTFLVFIQTKVYSLDTDSIIRTSSTKTLPSFNLGNREEAINNMIMNLHRLIHNYDMSGCNVVELALVGSKLCAYPEAYSKDYIRHWSYSIYIEELKAIAKEKSKVYGQLGQGLIISVENKAITGDTWVELYKEPHTEITLEKLQTVPSLLETCSEFRRYVLHGKFRETEEKGKLQRVTDLYTYEIENQKDLQKVKLKNLIYSYKGLKVVNKTEIKEVTTLLNKNYATIDIETYESKEDKMLLPYAIAVYLNKDEHKVFYLGDYLNDEKYLNIENGKDFNKKDVAYVNMIMDCLDYIVKLQIKRLYAHNASEFDNIILLRLISLILAKGVKIATKCEVKKEAIRKLSVIYKGQTFTIKDSYLLMPQSLDALCRSFGIPTKLPMPHKFMGPDKLKYKGPQPGIEYYEKMNEEEYKKLPEVLDIKRTVHEYILRDCETLHNIIARFRKEIFAKFKIDCWDKETISGLGYDIWLNTTATLDKIEIIPNGIELWKNIRKTYYGGITEVIEPMIGLNQEYEPVDPDSVKAWYYDVNSLYPYIMKTYEMPIGEIEYTLEIELENFFGFCKAKIEAPTQEIMLLPLWTELGLITPTGRWEGWYFSEELKKAKELGYKIIPMEGYKFGKRAKIFEEYVDRIYKLKQTNEPVQRNLAKLLLNTLYGMFGYNQAEEIKMKVLANEDYLTDKNSSSDYNNLNELIHMENFGKANIGLKTNVAIASAISSYARIYMYEYRKNAIYHDTDSVVLRSQLGAEKVSSTELGKFKLEWEINYGVFLANKTYGFKAKEGTKIVSAGYDSTQISLEEMIKTLKGKERIVKRHEILVKDLRTLIIRRVGIDKTLTKESTTRLNIYTRTEGGNLMKVRTLPWEVNEEGYKLPTEILKKYEKEKVREKLEVEKEDERKIIVLNTKVGKPRKRKGNNQHKAE